jgi:hypothetical protein
MASGGSPTLQVFLYDVVAQTTSTNRVEAAVNWILGQHRFATSASR